jgi:phosphomannomutase
MTQAAQSATLASTLDHQPRVLAFGTSGRRGRVADLTQLEIYINASAELEYLKSLPAGQGGIIAGDEFYFACDLRPSSNAFAPEEQGRGEIAQAIVRAIADAGMTPVNCGRIPTPALAFYALSRGKGSIMVTGSHIPFDRNGYKTNTSRGELLKEHEAPIGEYVARARERILNDSAEASLFNAAGMLRQGHIELPPEQPGAAEAYMRRYIDFFGASALAGMRIVCYQHSAVGRDMLVEILRGVGAEVFPMGRSEEFIPIDTENIDAERLDVIQKLADDAIRAHGHIDAIVSTDGDSDRPLLLGIEADSGRVRFFGGDLLGMIVAEYLDADAVVVPVSCNDGIDRGSLAARLAAKTRIGSPYVIAGMEAAQRAGKKRVCGWEANGGFLTGSAIERDGRTLAALPTRDALLPLLAALTSARAKNMNLCDLFDILPRRFSRAGLIKQFPRPVSLKIVRSYSPTNASIHQAAFELDGVIVRGDDCVSSKADAESAAMLLSIRSKLAEFFTPALGFGEIVGLNYVDGVRILFANGDVAHLRPSGNADELRIYAVADTPERAEQIVAMGIAEPDGVLRTMERAAS